MLKWNCEKHYYYLYTESKYLFWIQQSSLNLLHTTPVDLRIANSSVVATLLFHFVDVKICSMKTCQQSLLLMEANDVSYLC